MSFTLSNDFTRVFKYDVVVVGCGGTGGFVAEGLCRLLAPNLPIVLVDPDCVEERNLNRQNYSTEDLGLMKSETLARRLSQKYRRPVAYSTNPISMTKLGQSSIVIGCVDNGPARGDIAKKFQNINSRAPEWWIDSGNGENFGQVLIGNSLDHNINSYYLNERKYRYWPAPTLQMPELLRQQPKARNCADNTEEQGPTINQGMASLVVEVTRRLIVGTCEWVQLYLDMDRGTLQPVFPSPEILEDILINKKEVKI